MFAIAEGIVELSRGDACVGRESAGTTCHGAERRQLVVDTASQAKTLRRCLDPAHFVGRARKAFEPPLRTPGDEGRDRECEHSERERPTSRKGRVTPER